MVQDQRSRILSERRKSDLIEWLIFIFKIKLEEINIEWNCMPSFPKVTQGCMLCK